MQIGALSREILEEMKFKRVMVITVHVACIDSEVEKPASHGFIELNPIDVQSFSRFFRPWGGGDGGAKPEYL